jgi:hypothetical protein
VIAALGHADRRWGDRGGRRGLGRPPQFGPSHSTYIGRSTSDVKLKLLGTWNYLPAWSVGQQENADAGEDSEEGLKRNREPLKFAD